MVLSGPIYEAGYVIYTLAFARWRRWARMRKISAGSPTNADAQSVCGSSNLAKSSAVITYTPYVLNPGRLTTCISSSSCFDFATKLGPSLQAKFGSCVVQNETASY